MSITDMHTSARLQKLKDRRNLNIATIAHARRLTQFRLHPPRDRAHRLNQEHIMVKERANNTKYEKCFVVRAISLWNSLNMCFKILPTVRLFKSRVKSEMKLNKLNFPE